MKCVLSPLVLVAVVTTACGDGLGPSSVAGVYERVEVPAILFISALEPTTHNGQPAMEESVTWVDWEHFTLTAASSWTREAGVTEVARVLLLDGTVVDSFDVGPDTLVFSGSFTLSPPDTLCFASQGEPAGCAIIVPPDLFVGDNRFTRR